MSKTTKAFIVAIAVMGVIRFILDADGVPKDVVKYFSMSAIMIVYDRRSPRVELYVGHRAPDNFPHRRIFHGYVDRGSHAWPPDRGLHLGTASYICND